MCFLLGLWSESPARLRNQLIFSTQGVHPNPDCRLSVWRAAKRFLLCGDDPSTAGCHDWGTLVGMESWQEWMLSEECPIRHRRLQDSPPQQHRSRQWWEGFDGQEWMECRNSMSGGIPGTEMSGGWMWSWDSLRPVGRSHLLSSLPFPPQKHLMHFQTLPVGHLPHDFQCRSISVSQASMPR